MKIQNGIKKLERKSINQKHLVAAFPQFMVYSVLLHS